MIYGIFFPVIPALLCTISVGITCGQGIEILLNNFGMEAVVRGLVPHAGFELFACILAAFMPIYLWEIILFGFLRKNSLAKKKLVKKSIYIIVTCFAAMCVFLRIAAFLEYRISENYFNI